MSTKILRFGMCALAAIAIGGCETLGIGGPSDEEMIQETVNDAFAALTAQDIETMMTFYADDYNDAQGQDKAAMQEFLQGAKDQGFLDGIDVDMTPMEIAIDGETATAKPIELEGAFGMLTVELDLEKRDGKWVVVSQSQY